MRYSESKMMITNLKFPSILMDTNLKICKSKSKTMLSVLKPKMRRKKMTNLIPKAMPSKNLPGVSLCPRAVKCKASHRI